MIIVDLMNSYIYIKVTPCNNIFVVTAYSLKVFLRKFMGQRVKIHDHWNDYNCA